MTEDKATQSAVMTTGTEGQSRVAENGGAEREVAECRLLVTLKMVSAPHLRTVCPTFR